MGIYILHAPRAGGCNLHVSISALICRCMIPMQLSLKRANYGHPPQQPRREPYFLSSHTLYLTSQRTKPGDL